MSLEDKAYILGRLMNPFLISFLIVHYKLKKSYFKKHNIKMSILGVLIRIFVIGLLIGFLQLFLYVSRIMYSQM